MKKFCLLLMAICCFYFSTAQAEAEVTDLGDICLFLAPDIQVEGTYAFAQLGVLSYGAGHFDLNGKMTGFLWSDVTGPAHGTAMIDGETIVMSLTNTSTRDINSPHYPGFINELHIVLSGPNFSGRYILMGSALEQPFSGGGTVTIVNCP